MYWVGAVFSQIDEQGVEKPVAYAPQTLALADYSQLEKEALVLNFGTKRFHDYLYRCNFTLYTVVYKDYNDYNQSQKNNAHQSYSGLGSQCLCMRGTVYRKQYNQYSKYNPPL